MSLRRALVVFCAALLVIGLSADRLPRWQTEPSPPPMPTAEENGSAHVNGISMFYAIYGQGPPLLLIHGGMSSSDVWAGEIPLLAQKHEVIVADSRGQGRSTRTNERLTYTLMAKDYLALLNYLGLHAVAVVGWSDGATIGLDLAIHHPDRLTALFAQAGNASPDGLVTGSRLHRYLGKAKRQVVAIYEAGGIRVRAMLGIPPAKPDPSSATRKEIFELWATEPHYSQQQLASIRTRTAIVIGDHDDAIRPEHTEYLARTIPGAQFIVLHDVGHAAMLEDPVGYARAVLGFLDD